MAATVAGGHASGHATVERAELHGVGIDNDDVMRLKGCFGGLS